MKKSNIFTYIILLSIAIWGGYNEVPFVIKSANIISFYFVICFKWLSIPLISFAILSTTKNMQSKTEFLKLGSQIFRYTFITTIIAATVALGYFLLLNPTNTNIVSSASDYSIPSGSPLYGYLLIGALISTIMLAFLIINLNGETRIKVESFITNIYKLLQNTIKIILLSMPFAIASFVTLFIDEFDPTILYSIGIYLMVIVLANLTQAILVLPTLLKMNKLPVVKTFIGIMPALVVAFWSKSSSVALPVAIDCAVDRLKMNPKIAKFSLPLCTTINMNACAAFILISVLFVSTSHGAVFSNSQYAIMILVATISAIGNAGVPMGCYTLSCALLSYMGHPLYLMGLILPCYNLIDMLESAINVWSDLCVTAVVEYKNR